MQISKLIIFNDTSATYSHESAEHLLVFVGRLQEEKICLLDSIFVAISKRSRELEELNSVSQFFYAFKFYSSQCSTEISTFLFFSLADRICAADKFRRM